MWCVTIRHMVLECVCVYVCAAHMRTGLVNKTSQANRKVHFFAFAICEGCSEDGKLLSMLGPFDAIFVTVGHRNSFEVHENIVRSRLL